MHVTLNEHYTLGITANALTALESLRFRRKVRTIWIDSICIDQKNTKEKQSQVPLMVDVYRSAAVVNVWLGRASVHPEPRNIIMGLFECDIWRRAWREVRGDLKASTIGPESLTNTSDIKQLARKQAISNIRSDFGLFWHALRGRHMALANAIKTNPPWHERLWIVQEYLLAKQVRFGFGYHWVSCDVAFLLGWATDDDDALGLFKKALGFDFEAVRWNIDRMTGQPNLSLGGLQNILSTQKCSQPEDMVYGMLGLIDPYEASLITVDYNMGFWKTFAQATYAAIRGQTTFEVLDVVDLRACHQDGVKASNHESLIDAHQDPSKRLPSWTIDFAHFPEACTWKENASHGVDLAKRREQLQKNCSLSETCERLRIKAIPFDKIAVHAPVEMPAEETHLGEDDVVYKLLFSVVSPTLVAALRARELAATGGSHDQPLLAARLLSSHVKADDVQELLSDAEMFSRRVHAFLSIAMPPAANMTMTIQSPGQEDQVIPFQVTGANFVPPQHDPVINAIKTVCLLWDSLIDTPADMQRAGQVRVDVENAKSFLGRSKNMLRNATVTSGGLTFFGTIAGGMVGIAPLGVGVNDLIVRAPDGESFLVLRRQGLAGDDDDSNNDVWQFVGRALIFSMHTSDSWEREELRGTMSINNAPTFNIC